MVEYFTDPILRAPTIGSMLIGLIAGLVGVLVFLRRQSLLGEALSHASFPGVIIGVALAGYFGVDPYSSGMVLPLFIVSGAIATALFGAWIIGAMVNKLSVRSDTALCFVLSAFFGIGITIASHIQFAYSSLYQQIQVYFYGQTATLTDFHLQVYVWLAFVVITALLIFYKEIQLVIFDRHYGESLGVRGAPIDMLLMILTVLAVVIGIRSVGVVLMSAMLIAPAAAARQFTHTLSRMLILSAFFGMASGFLGVYFSSELSASLAAQRLSLPTGPLIVLVSSMICLTSLLFAPKSGLMLRYLRIARFRYRCVCENILKAIWRSGSLSCGEIADHQAASALYLRFALKNLSRQGWVARDGESYCLTEEGVRWAAKIVRLHRLWEVYLADYLGVGAERVHRSAEEMEHIINPELEEELVRLLNDPKRDPHHQPIPPREGELR